MSVYRLPPASVEPDDTPMSDFDRNHERLEDISARHATLCDDYKRRHVELLERGGPGWYEESQALQADFERRSAAILATICRP